MTHLLTPHIATMTEMREPHKVLERANGKPVAILKNSALVGYFVPAEAIQSLVHSGHLTEGDAVRRAERIAAQEITT